MADDPAPDTALYARMAFHAALAGVVFFALNWFALSQPLDTSLLWGAVAAPFAAYLAWTQRRRG